MYRLPQTRPKNLLVPLSYEHMEEQSVLTVTQCQEHSGFADDAVKGFPITQGEDFKT